MVLRYFIRWRILASIPFIEKVMGLAKSVYNTSKEYSDVILAFFIKIFEKRLTIVHRGWIKQKPTEIRGPIILMLYSTPKLFAVLRSVI
jgi:hypothetical protein